jgi:peptidoglycan/LPS O-acetylase OafA/YrhL
MTKADLPPLTGVRFLAAFCVLAGHTTSVLLSNLDSVRWIDALAPFGMTVFFVLSGFVIHYNYGAMVADGTGRKRYCRARFARLYPLYFLMLCVYVALSSRTAALLHGHPESFYDVLRSLPFFLMLIQSWVYWPINQVDSLMGGIGGASPLTWSISTEIFFYGAFIFLAWPILRLRSLSAACAILVWSAAWMAATWVVIDSLPAINTWAVSYFGGIASPGNGDNSFAYWLTYMSPYWRIGDFILGCLAAQVYACLRGWGMTFVILALIGVGLTGGLLIGPAQDSFAVGPAVAATILFSVTRKSWLSTALSWRPVIALGDASYSIYLTHYVVLVALARMIPNHPLVAVAVAFGTIIPLSLWLFAKYETPMRKWIAGQPSTKQRFTAEGAFVE